MNIPALASLFFLAAGATCASLVASAETLRHEVISATRYTNLPSKPLKDELTQFIGYETFDQNFSEFPSDHQLLGGENEDLFSFVKRKVEASGKDQNLVVDIVVTAHGNEVVIASEFGPRITQLDFAKRYLELANELKGEGYSTGKLSFRFFLNYCNSGVFAEALPTHLPFETLIMSATSGTSSASVVTLGWILSRVNDILEAARYHQIKPCPQCTPAEELLLLANYFGRIDLFTGLADDGQALHQPTVKLISPKRFDEAASLQSTVHNMLRLYSRSLHADGMSKTFKDAFECVFADDDCGRLREIATHLGNQLTEDERLAHLFLNLNSRLDYLTSPQIDHHFQILGSHPDRTYRRLATDALLMYYDILEDGDHLVYRRFREELDQKDTSFYDLDRLEKHLASIGDTSPEATALCAEILTRAFQID